MPSRAFLQIRVPATSHTTMPFLDTWSSIFLGTYGGFTFSRISRTAGLKKAFSQVFLKHSCINILWQYYWVLKTRPLIIKRTRWGTFLRYMCPAISSFTTQFICTCGLNLWTSHVGVLYLAELKIYTLLLC